MIKRRRWLKWLLIVLAVFIVLVAITPLVPLDFLKPSVESRLSATLGRKVSVGSLRLSLWGGPYLTISGMTAKEDPAFGDGDFLKADQVLADFSLFQYLFNRRVVIEALTIKSPDFIFIKSRDETWSWTTLGNSQQGAQAIARASVFENASALFAALAALLDDKASGATLNNIRIENASVRLINLTKDQPSETLYKKIALRASLTPARDGASAAGNNAKGELRAESDESDGAEILKTTLPFDLSISRDASSGLQVSGTFGPGPFETRNFVAGSFNLSCQLNAQRKSQQSNNAQPSASGLSGQGHISAADVLLPRVNISEKLAKALQISSIGDMNPGTTVGSLDTDFQLGQGVYKTSGLRIQQLDGLGDAAADQGWFKIESALVLNYSVMVTLSEQTTNQVKSISQLSDWIVEIFKNNNRVNVSLNVEGDVRNPRMTVDVLKTLGF